MVTNLPRPYYVQHDKIIINIYTVIYFLMLAFISYLQHYSVHAKCQLQMYSE